MTSTNFLLFLFLFLCALSNGHFLWSDYLSLSESDSFEENEIVFEETDDGFLPGKVVPRERNCPENDFSLIDAISLDAITIWKKESSSEFEEEERLHEELELEEDLLRREEEQITKEEERMRKLYGDSWDQTETAAYSVSRKIVPKPASHVSPKFVHRNSSKTLVQVKRASGKNRRAKK